MARARRDFLSGRLTVSGYFTDAILRASMSLRSVTTTVASSRRSASNTRRWPFHRRCTAPIRRPCNWPTCWRSWRTDDLSTVKFQTGGAEVVEAAIKLARQYHKLTGSPGKFKIISRYQSWHGSTLGCFSAAGLKSRKTVNEPMGPRLHPRLSRRRVTDARLERPTPDCAGSRALIVEDDRSGME